MKKLIGLFVLIILISCKAKSDASIPDKWKNEDPEFVNQGEFEDYKTWKYFRDEYKKQSWQRYSGLIKGAQENILYNNDTVWVSCEKVLRGIFTSGIIYPDIFGVNDFQGGIKGISDVEELLYLKSSYKVKRFRMLVFYKRMANPQVYLFELTNNKAKINTSTEDFIKTSELTFLQNGWLII